MKNNKENKTVTMGVKVEEAFHKEIINKAGPVNISEILRALLRGWLNGDISLVWEDGKYKVEK